MNIFLKFLVMDWDGCFDNLEKTNDEFFELFKTGIEIGNEFLVQRYKDACSYCLLAKMDIKNVFSFYEHADTFECPAFKKACLDFSMLYFFACTVFIHSYNYSLLEFGNVLENTCP